MKNRLLLCLVTALTIIFSIQNLNANDLIVQIRKGNAKAVEKWIKEGKNLNDSLVIISDVGDTVITDALSYSAYLAQEEIVTLLIKNKSKFENYSSWVNKAIGPSVSGGNISIVKTILKEGADVNTPCGLCFGNTPITISLLTNRADIFQILKEKKPDMNKQGKIAPIHGAAFAASIELVKVLVEQDSVSLHSLSNEGQSVLWYAIIEGRLEIAEYLRQKGAELNHRNRDMEGLLHASVIHGDIKTVNWVLEHTLADEQLMPNPMSPIVFLVIENGSIEIFTLLAEKGMQVQDMNMFGRNALFALLDTKKNRADFANLLIEDYGLDLTQKDGFNKTVLDYAQENKDKELVKILNTYKK